MATLARQVANRLYENGEQHARDDPGAERRCVGKHEAPTESRMKSSTQPRADSTQGNGKVDIERRVYAGNGCAALPKISKALPMTKWTVRNMAAQRPKRDIRRLLTVQVSSNHSTLLAQAIVRLSSFLLRQEDVDCIFASRRHFALWTCSRQQMSKRSSRSDSAGIWTSVYDLIDNDLLFRNRGYIPSALSEPAFLEPANRDFPPVCKQHAHFHNSEAQTPTPALPNKMTPLQKFIFPHLSTSANVSAFSLASLPLSALLDSSVMVPHMSSRVYGASPKSPTAAAT